MKIAGSIARRDPAFRYPDGRGVALGQDRPLDGAAFGETGRVDDRGGFGLSPGDIDRRVFGPLHLDNSLGEIGERIKTAAREQAKRDNFRATSWLAAMKVDAAMRVNEGLV